MKQGMKMLYECFSICMYCIAVVLLVYLSRSVYKLEHRVNMTMYQQHVITCTLEEA